MKRIVAILIILLVGQPVFSQSDHSAFVSEVLKEYHKKEAEFRKEAIKEAKAIQKNFGIVFPDSLHFVPMPDLYLKNRSREFYKTADPADLIEYFDPQSMRMVGFILMDGNYNYVNIYPKIDKSLIYDFYMKYKPELIFDVCNMPSSFAIINNKLYAIRRTDSGLVPQTIEEYLVENKEDILFGLYLGYQPLYDN